MNEAMPELTPLPRSFYCSAADVVASRLLGHWLIRVTSAGVVGGPIVETEAYLHDDPACHAFRGVTPRNGVMFGPPGHSYVYFIYGVHYCVNAVCQPVGCGEAVLIRAVEATFGSDQLRRCRSVNGLQSLTNGPAKLCQAMAIGRALNGVDLCDRRSPLYIAQNPQWAKFRAERAPLITTTRVGITRGADLPLRFYLSGSEFISRRGLAAKWIP